MIRRLQVRFLGGTPHVLEHEVGHAVGIVDYVRLAALVSAMAKIGGALGSALESDETVR